MDLIFDLPKMLGGSSTLRYLDDEMWLDDKCIKYADITSVTRNSMVQSGLTGRKINTTMIVTSDSDKIKASWSYKPRDIEKNPAMQVSHASVAVLRDRVGGRIAQQIVAEGPEFLAWKFTPEGVSRKGMLGGKTVPWPRIMGVTYNPDEDATNIVYDDNGKQRTLGLSAECGRNGIFLPDVLDAYAAALGVTYGQ